MSDDSVRGFFGGATGAVSLLVLGVLHPGPAATAAAGAGTFGAGGSLFGLLPGVFDQENNPLNFPFVALSAIPKPSIAHMVHQNPSPCFPNSEYPISPITARVPYPPQALLASRKISQRTFIPPQIPASPSFPIIPPIAPIHCQMPPVSPFGAVFSGVPIASTRDSAHRGGFHPFALFCNGRVPTGIVASPLIVSMSFFISW